MLFEVTHVVYVRLFREFSWSPAENKLAYWLPEQNEIPARVTILGLPSKQELRVKNLFNVADIRLHWHKQGQFLCVKVDRYNKTKKVCWLKSNVCSTGIIFVLPSSVVTCFDISYGTISAEMFLNLLLIFELISYLDCSARPFTPNGV